MALDPRPARVQDPAIITRLGGHTHKSAGWPNLAPCEGLSMRRIDALRTLALSSALILALGGTSGASEEDTSDSGEPPGDEVSTPAETPEEEADETSLPA